MRLKEFMDKLDIGDCVIWQDDTIDYALEFTITDELYLNKRGTSKLKNLLMDRLTVLEVHNENTVSVNLYELMDDEVLLDYAEKNINEIYGFHDYEKNVERLTIDVINFIMFGADKFCEKMIQAFHFADLQEKENNRIEDRGEMFRINTPMGNIIVGIKSDYHSPGVYIDLQGDNIREGHKENTVSLVSLEYDVLNNKIRTAVYGDSIRDEPSVIIEHGNYNKRAFNELISSAENRKAICPDTFKAEGEPEK